MRREDLLGGPQPEDPAPQEAIRYGTVLRDGLRVVMVTSQSRPSGYEFRALVLVKYASTGIYEEEEGKMMTYYNANWDVIE